MHKIWLHEADIYFALSWCRSFVEAGHIHEQIQWIRGGGCSRWRYLVSKFSCAILPFCSNVSKLVPSGDTVDMFLEISCGSCISLRFICPIWLAIVNHIWFNFQNQSWDAIVIRGQSVRFSFSSSDHVGPPNYVHYSTENSLTHLEHIIQYHCNTCLFGPCIPTSLVKYHSNLNTVVRFCHVFGQSLSSLCGLQRSPEIGDIVVSNKWKGQAC